MHDPAKKEEYKAPVYEMLDRILEIGRNEDGLFYNSVDPVKGIPVNGGIADNFGYTLNGFYTVYLIDKIEKYREPVLKAYLCSMRNTGISHGKDQAQMAMQMQLKVLLISMPGKQCHQQHNG